MKRTPIQRRILTWPEVTLLLAQDQSKTWIPPKFPTRRWGNIYTLTSTTDKLTVEHLVTQLQNLGYKVKRKKDKEKTLQHKNLGIFYSIEIQESIQHIDQLD
jgi:hypothetical protein